MTIDPCMSYCKHGGVCILESGHKEKHNSNYCVWDDEEGLTKEEADKILIRKNPTIGKIIAKTEEIILKKMGKI
ncbi:MAG: hypothetical protein IIA87_03235 [Nanoarchaeota archaeon]|nr:hypothetical protein [Nanoarchaeota archaeon]